MQQAEYQHPDLIICPLVEDCMDVKNISFFRLPISNSEEPKKNIWHLNMMLEIFEGNGVSELYFNQNLDALVPVLK